MGCATGIVKYLVFLANLIFALAGLALVIIGVMYKFNYNDATNVLPRDFGLAPILSIIIGAVVFITAFLGCCGAVKESPCMLTTYAIILLTIFIIQVAIGVYAFLKIKDTNEFHNSIRQNLQKTFEAYDKNPEAKEAVEVTQRFFSCCGVDGPDYYQGELPLSCCEEGVDACRRIDYAHLHHDGCVQKVYNFLENSSQVIGGVAIGVAAIEILGAFFGLCLASSIRNHYRRSLYA